MIDETVNLHTESLVRTVGPVYQGCALILPWNLRDETVGQMRHIRGWGGQFVVPIPEVKVYP
jgi:C-methyltransferase-like protein